MGPFAVQSVGLTADGLRVRFPLRTKDIGLGTGPAPLQGGPAALRVADLRRSRPAEQLNLVRIDGTAAGSLETSDDANPSGYRSVPAGTYVVVTNRAGGGDPVIRQVAHAPSRGDLHARTVLCGRIQPGRAATRTGRPAHRPHARLRRADAACCQCNGIRLPGAGSTRHGRADGAGEPGWLRADHRVCRGARGAVRSGGEANGREWRQPVEFLGGEPMSLLLTDGPDGPVLRTLRDVPEAPAALNPPTLTMPASVSAVDKTKAKTPAIERSDGRRIAVALCLAAIICVAVLMARGRPRRPGQQSDVALHEAVRARWRGGEVVRRAVDTTARLPRWGRQAFGSAAPAGRAE